MSPSMIRQQQLKKLRRILRHIFKKNCFYRNKLRQAGIRSAEDIKTWKDYKGLPFTNKKELSEDQLNNPPFGTNLTSNFSEILSVIRTSGTTGNPLYWFETRDDFRNRMRTTVEVLKMAGVGKKDRILFHTPPSMFSGLNIYEIGQRLEAMVLPGDGMTNIERIENIIKFKATVLWCTPLQALHLAELARDRGIDLSKSSIRVVHNGSAAGASVPTIKKRIESDWGAICIDRVGSIEGGLFAAECTKRKGPHILRRDFITEVIDASSDKPATSGELVLTNLTRTGSPIIRYRTGDLVKITNAKCTCGLTYPRLLGGILGRNDSRIKLGDGNSFYPRLFDDVLFSYKEILEYRVEIKKHRNRESVVVSIEVRDNVNSQKIVDSLEESLRKKLAFTPIVKICNPKTLERFNRKPNRIIDLRETQDGGQKGIRKRLVSIPKNLNKYISSLTNSIGGE